MAQPPVSVAATGAVDRLGRECRMHDPCEYLVKDADSSGQSANGLQVLAGSASLSLMRSRSTARSCSPRDDLGGAG